MVVLNYYENSSGNQFQRSPITKSIKFSCRVNFYRLLKLGISRGFQVCLKCYEFKQHPKSKHGIILETRSNHQHQWVRSEMPFASNDITISIVKSNQAMLLRNWVIYYNFTCKQPLHTNIVINTPGKCNSKTHKQITTDSSNKSFLRNINPSHQHGIFQKCFILIFCVRKY